jgi:hypothetical protein
MMKSKLIVAVAGVGLLVGVLVIPGIALAWGPQGTNQAPFGGMMGGYPYAGADISGVGDVRGGMMGGWSVQGLPSQSKTIDLDGAQQAVETYLASANNPDLTLDEIMEFQYNFYAIVKEKSTGIGAFELLVDKSNGNVYPEMGPNMMWNTKYGMMSGYGGRGMMGGRSGGMMGRGNRANQVNPSNAPSVTVQQARTTAQQWLDQNQPGSSTETPDTFYGYYTVHTLANGQPSGMLSVNAYTGQVWYHTWHGDFIQLKDLGQ